MNAKKYTTSNRTFFALSVADALRSIECGEHLVVPVASLPTMRSVIGRIARNGEGRWTARKGISKTGKIVGLVTRIENNPIKVK